ncbi:L-ascorbate 6-phosphate lactonase [Lacticaseibacillus zeae]|uniref:L-ascorbate 6-phosphate lactonase n=1 Tax=Lacticaseibacillus zeae TaxID=57037 RepID=A0A5R8LNU9_LACZE|nr:L-ascorbate 6-phosphate lactonase [Lacticaseibacillus zeae]TLF38904.1 L-ascorbate 6-phosphate lactonase [Lacticaseibacillus zeae]
MKTTDERLTDITEDSWIRETFPEWGNWLNESINRFQVAPNHMRLWWLGNMGIWIKDAHQNNLAIDLWAGTGKQTHYLPKNGERHQWQRMLGAQKAQPNLRHTPQVFNPFSITSLDALLVTHYHHDHLDRNVAAAIINDTQIKAPLIGPQAVVNQWMAWGVPESRVKVVHPGDVFNIKNIRIQVLPSYDRTILITDPVGMEIPDDRQIPDINERAVAYLITTSAGTIYHAGDSHYSVNFADIGRQYSIDLALLAFAENPIGVQDKMTSVDILRAAEALGTKIVIPLHWDIWTNTLGDPREIQMLYQYRKDRFQYQFHPFIWQIGGSYDWPSDRDLSVYNYPRGFDDRFQRAGNLPFGSFL